MTHFDETALIDLLDGQGSSTQRAHLDACAGCRGELDALRAALARTADAAVPEPSPLYWEHFPRQVNERIDAPATSPWTFWIRGPRLALVSAAAVMFAVLIGSQTLRAPLTPADTAPAAIAALAPVAEPMDDIEEDAAWAVVRTAAEDLWYDEAEAEGIAVRPGSAEHAVMSLTAEERAELARLIEDELKRSGA
jgi:hypothetical protein